MQDIFSSLLVPVLLDDVGCEHALLLGVGRRKKSELKTRDCKKGEGKKGRGRGEPRGGGVLDISLGGEVRPGFSYPDPV